MRRDPQVGHPLFATPKVNHTMVKYCLTKLCTLLLFAIGCCYECVLFLFLGLLFQIFQGLITSIHKI